MIKNKKVANEISILMLEFGARIDASVLMVKQQCSNAEFEEYRKAAAKIMAEMLDSFMNPIYKAHPDLKPPELD